MVANGPNEAVQNARAVNRYDTGMCQKYVRDQCWRVPSLYGSAIDAWNGAKYKHPGDRTPPKGAPMYYKGGNYGHAVICPEDNKARIRSTDCTSGGQVSEADIAWVENNWGYTYLGWTEDINGVRVIHEQGNDDVKDEDIAKIASRVNHVLGDYNSEGKTEDPDTAELGDQRLRQIENVVRGLKTDVDKILKKLG